MITNKAAQEISRKLAEKIIEGATNFLKINGESTGGELIPLPDEKGIRIKVMIIALPAPLLINVLIATRDDLAPGTPLTILTLDKDYQFGP